MLVARFCVAVTLLALADAQWFRQHEVRREPPHARQSHKPCPSECNEETCDEVKKVCPAGMVKDVCDCCMTCGKRADEQCDVEVVNDQRGHFDRSNGYIAFYGRCGVDLECVAAYSDPGINGGAFCHCADARPVCGDDRRTYANKCRLNEGNSGRRDPVSITRYEPCDQEPTIVNPPRNLEEIQSADIVISCEAQGYPAPRIEWTFTSQEDGSAVVMPGDNQRRSVQLRGGPEPYQVTSWLYLQGAQKEDTGIYTCVAKNAFGKTSARSEIRIRDKPREL